ncbi:hypothetical protein CAI21_00460 [Alkalilimnicola ehrlichii]|uniref:DUF3135 domain-containing protein n=1 Tax=Alkalilimnicola ehrlichii TaxID=351052 RepID=A0A3E0X1R6_9GAMM|nr:DUF3135 domain-containing protein [Alkalilimnicola ehrlichii]RFA31163.1 hypothetical protein CAI21_00460 [Alkalilimnicola ehrlichii]RFA39551.1 hypothetical protein CAL65_01945 [Alkalilimnicola ehrlichii]
MQRTAQEPDFDFDAWAKLANRDPAEFEARRAEYIEQFIRLAPPDRQDRLRRLQWRIDRTRDCASNPLAACLRISAMMWDSLLGERGLLKALEDARDGNSTPASSAQIIEFSQKSAAERTKSERAH